MRRLALLTLILGLLAVPAHAGAAAWPSNKLELGLADGPNGAAALKRTAKVRFRYQYLAAGVNTGNGWRPGTPPAAS